MQNKMIDDRIKEMTKDLGIAFQLAGTTQFGAVAEVLVNAGYCKISDFALEEMNAVDKFRSNLMNEFINLCSNNDYNKLTLLKIGDAVDEIFDKTIAEIKKKHTGEEGKNS